MENFEEIYYRYNPWWEGQDAAKGVMLRPYALELLLKNLDSKEIVFLTGLRRIGKTTLLKLLIANLLERNAVRPENIFFISLDDYMLSRYSLLEIIDNYRKIKKIKSSEKIFLFLDEVTYKQDYEIQLKNLYDLSNVKIFASSSSASIMRSKKPYLTGRYVVVELLPLDFKEFLEFKNIKISKADKGLFAEYFKDYMKTGGVPEYVLKQDPEYLKELVDNIINKDIANFYKIKNTGILKELFLLLMERSGKQVSINKLSKILGTTPDSVKRYLSMFSETYLIYLVSRCGKTNEKILSPKKVYCADLGIRNLFTGFKDIGSIFENYVYLKIKRLNPCYIYQNGIEIDFLTNDNTLIEVKYDYEMNEKQKKLFEDFKCKRKIEIKSIYDLEENQIFS